MVVLRSTGPTFCVFLKKTFEGKGWFKMHFGSIYSEKPPNDICDSIIKILKSVSSRNTLLTSEVECQGDILEHASVQIKVLEPCHFRRLIELSNDINLTLSIYLWFISRVIHAKM